MRTLPRYRHYSDYPFLGDAVQNPGQIMALCFPIVEREMVGHTHY